MLVYVLRVGLHAGRSDPGWCLSVQILRIPGKSSTSCYVFYVEDCVFSSLTPCV